MHESLLLGVATVFVLGLGAQWIAWRFRFPSILLLLVFGFVAGPVTGLLAPEQLQGDWVFTFVAVSVGIILFEGGLSLRLDELRDVKKAVRNLITIGVAITGVLAGLGAYYLLGFNVALSVVIGAILTVTGPTVVIPLLRHVRPSGRVGTVAKWEGITIDPIGAIIAVLVLETVILLEEAPAHGGEGIGGALGHLFEGLMMEAVVGVGAAAIGTVTLVLLLRRRLVPDFLQNPLTLAMVVAIFAVSNLLKEESGLLATTLMGIALANQKYFSVRRLIEFKEDLRVLLISLLFIVLSARLDLSALNYVTWESLLFLAALILVIRPIAAWVSLAGTAMTGKEKAFLAWLAPRGIVAAAVASLFSFRLEPYFPAQTDGLVPIIFLVIVGTVAVYGLTISPVARWLGLASPDPQGVLFVGAHAWARALASALHEEGFAVLMVDSNPKNVREARRRGLPARRTNVLAEGVTDELDLGGIGRLLALTPNEEVNSLAALHFSEIFETSDTYQLAARSSDGVTATAELPQHLRGQPLFGPAVTFVELEERFEAGAEVRTIPIADRDTFGRLLTEYEEVVVPLFLVRGSSLYVFSQRDSNPTPQAGDRLIVLISPLDDERELRVDAEGSLLGTAVLPGSSRDDHDVTDPKESEPGDMHEVAEGNEPPSPHPVVGDKSSSADARSDPRRP